MERWLRSTRSLSQCQDYGDPHRSHTDDNVEIYSLAEPQWQLPYSPAIEEPLNTTTAGTELILEFSITTGLKRKDAESHVKNAETLGEYCVAPSVRSVTTTKHSPYPPHHPLHNKLDITGTREGPQSLHYADSFRPALVIPPTDSAYGSGPIPCSGPGKFNIDNTAINPTTTNEVELDSDETATVYSDASSTGSVQKWIYIWDLAESIFGNLNSFTTNSETANHISSALPTLLQDFALRLGYNATTQMYRDAMVFVHRHR